MDKSVSFYKNLYLVEKSLNDKKQMVFSSNCENIAEVKQILSRLNQNIMTK